MKKIIFGVCALLAIVMALMCFKLFAGTYLAYCGLLMLLISGAFIDVAIESDKRLSEMTNNFIERLMKD